MLQQTDGHVNGYRLKIRFHLKNLDESMRHVDRRSCDTRGVQLDQDHNPPGRTAIDTSDPHHCPPLEKGRQTE
jgi:hypothetical protein